MLRAGSLLALFLYEIHSSTRPNPWETKITLAKGKYHMFDCQGKSVLLRVGRKSHFELDGRKLKFQSNRTLPEIVERLCLVTESGRGPIRLDQHPIGPWAGNWKFCYPTDWSGPEGLHYDVGEMRAIIYPENDTLTINVLKDSNSLPIGPP